MLIVIWVKNFLIAIGKPILRLIKLTGRIKFRINLRWRWSYIVLTILSLLMTGGLIWFYFNILIDLPSVNEVYNPPKLTTKILDRNGVLLYKFYEDENRSWVPLSKIPQSLVWATLAVEDKDYYNHHGLSPKGIVQALIFDIFKKDDDDKLRGGSTITQQLVKSVFLSDEKTIQRKMKEAVLAIMVENKLSKDEILERYFNQVAYGGNTYGAEEASLKYFGKDVWNINTAEASFLAGLPAAPTSYSPFGNSPGLGYVRQRHVVEEMVAAGYLTEESANKIRTEKLSILGTKSKILAPHFVFYVKDYLEKKFGYQNFNRRGLVIKTSLDINTQIMAEKIVSEEVAGVERMKISNGAALILNPKNGEILAMVGSKDYDSKTIDGKYNVTVALRQPGSSIKPVNYLLALMKGWSLASIVEDSATTYRFGNQAKPYTPQNYNGKYMGMVTLRTALASSLNTPSVKILDQNGTNNMIDLAEKMGINTWQDRSRFGLALALGSGEVKMTELANAYSTFANLGEKTELNPVLEINNYLGETVYKSNPELKEIVDPKLAYMIDNVLSDNIARSPVFGLGSKLKIDGKTVAVKTGTTNNLKDNWCIGWTPSVMVAAWVGNNDSSPMSWVASGVSGATPIWNRIIKEVLRDKNDEPWPVPNGVYKARVCGKEELFVNGTEKKIRCPVITPTPTPTS